MFMSIVPLLQASSSSFDPEVISTLAAAYQHAWEKIELSGSTYASPRYRRAAQEVIAKRIIDMAQSGEIETVRLADDAVDYLARSYA
jgi:hypothetical protein